jgi:hypothetical chaperone protein
MSTHGPAPGGRPVYAIDFGTSNSLLGCAAGGRALGFAPLDPLARDPGVMRSLIYFPNASKAYFGSEAVSEFSANDHAGRFIRSIKKQLPSRSFVGTYVDSRAFNLEDLIGVFLAELRRRANAHFKLDVTAVVLGRPARFAPDDADDRYAEGRLERAARIAGFKEIEFMPEPVAASLGYAPGARMAGARERIVYTADFGGGTSDFTAYRLGSGKFSASDVLAMGGVSVAGDALDAALMRKRISPWFGTGVRYQVPFGSNVLTMPLHLMERICHPAEISLLRKQDTMEFLRNVRQWSLKDDDRERMDRLFALLNDQLGFPLFERIEATKRALSDSDEALFEFTYPDIEIRERISRNQFEDYAATSLESIARSMDETFTLTGLRPEQVDEVLCTGGTARVPWIRQALSRKFGAGKLKDLDPFRGVAQGLLERARELSAD